MRFILPWFLILMACTGGTPVDSPCPQPSDCAASEACVGGQCVPELDVKVPDDADIMDDVVATDIATDIAADIAADTTPERPEPIRVLFLGNSYTYQNDLPGVVRALAQASGVVIQTEMIAKGGASLSSHHSDGVFAARIAEGGIDHIVIQGQSTEGLPPATYFLSTAPKIASMLAEKNVPATWFATWPRQPGHSLYAAFGIPSAAEMSKSIEGSYQIGASINRDFVARVGAAWLLALEELPTINLYAGDGSHPSQAGTLLAACVLAQGIAGLAPTLPKTLAIPHADAERLCALAPRVACAEPTTFCHGGCVSLAEDPAHCGACDAACPAATICVAGTCG